VNTIEGAPSPPLPRRPCTGSADGAIVGLVYFVYILRCADGTLYTGSTNDVQAREETHNSGRGAKYTASRRPVRVVHTEAHETRSAALKREAQLKTWPRAQKEALIAGALPAMGPGGSSSDGVRR